MCAMAAWRRLLLIRESSFHPQCLCQVALRHRCCHCCPPGTFSSWSSGYSSRRRLGLHAGTPSTCLSSRGWALPTAACSPLMVSSVMSGNGSLLWCVSCVQSCPVKCRGDKLSRMSYGLVPCFCCEKSGFRFFLG